MVPIDLTKIDGLIEGFGRLMLGGSQIPDQLLDSEPPIIEGDPGAYIEMIPEWIKKVLIFVLDKVGMKRECVFLKCIGDPTLKNYVDAAVLKRNFARDFNKLMVDQNLDGYISPACSTPAFKHFESKDLSMVSKASTNTQICFVYLCSDIVFTLVSDLLLDPIYKNPLYR